MYVNCDTVCCYNFMLKNVHNSKYCTKNCYWLSQDLMRNKNHKWYRRNKNRTCEYKDCVEIIYWWNSPKKMYCDDHLKQVSYDKKKIKNKKLGKVIVGETTSNCIVCNKKYTLTNANKKTCSKKCNVEHQNNVRKNKWRSKHICQCGNVSHNNRGLILDCSQCIQKKIKKTNWILLDELPKYYSIQCRFECKTCRTESFKSISQVLHKDKRDYNCNSCSRSNVSTHYDNNDKGYFYVVENDLMYKYGVSYRVEDRVNEHKRSNLYPHIQIEFKTLQEAYSFERLVKRFVRENNLEFTGNYNFICGGKTETICKSKAKDVTAKWLLNIMKDKVNE